MWLSSVLMYWSRLSSPRRSSACISEVYPTMSVNINATSRRSSRSLTAPPSARLEGRKHRHYDDIALRAAHSVNLLAIVCEDNEWEYGWEYGLVSAGGSSLQLGRNVKSWSLQLLSANQRWAQRFWSDF